MLINFDKILTAYVYDTQETGYEQCKTNSAIINDENNMFVDKYSHVNTEYTLDEILLYNHDLFYDGSKILKKAYVTITFEKNDSQRIYFKTVAEAYQLYDTIKKTGKFLEF